MNISKIKNFNEWQKMLKQAGWFKTKAGEIEPIKKRFEALGNPSFSENDVIKGIIHISKSIAYIKSGISILEKYGVSLNTDSFRELYAGYFYIALGFEILYGEHCLKIIAKKDDIKTICIKNNRIITDQLSIKTSTKLNEYLTELQRFDLLIGLKPEGKNIIINHLNGNYDKSIEEVDLFYLARAYRNAFAHGALSPTKIKQFGLANSLVFLANSMLEKVNGTMGMLVGRS